MVELKRCFDAAGFTEVVTVLSSGNVVFTSDDAPEVELQQRTEAAMTNGLGRTFPTIVRPLDELAAMVEADPFAGFNIEVGSKRVVTFLRLPPPQLALPITYAGATIWAATDKMVFTSYITNPNGPEFMNLIERTFSKNVTTRTWQTILKCIAV